VPVPTAVGQRRETRSETAVSSPESGPARESPRRAANGGVGPTLGDTERRAGDLHETRKPRAMSYAEFYERIPKLSESSACAARAARGARQDN